MSYICGETAWSCQENAAGELDNACRTPPRKGKCNPSAPAAKASTGTDKMTTPWLCWSEAREN